MRGDRPSGPDEPGERAQFTPHARGSTHGGGPVGVGQMVYPACAGIDRHSQGKAPGRVCLPRMRGDRPFEEWIANGFDEFTPHARGSTMAGHRHRSRRQVYPACAGIDLDTLFSGGHGACLPHMRGDRPPPPRPVGRLPLFTPHARGSTFFPIPIYLSACVYPACAGIDRTKRAFLHPRVGLPRMRGDRPGALCQSRWFRLFTPHARGSTPSKRFACSSLVVYPACAGIDHEHRYT